jgi:hypothetical protein
MNFRKFYPYPALIFLVFLIYVFHKVVFYVLNIKESNFQYSLEWLYLFFFIVSAIIMKILLIVRQKSFDNVGMSFLLATSVKMVFCYLILRPLLQISKTSNLTERINFFILFIVFLAIETLFTIRLVNEKQK